MHQRARGDHVPPKKPVPSSDGRGGPHARENTEHVPGVEKAELRVLGKVLDVLPLRLVVITAEPPAHVRVPEAALLGAVHVLRSVRVLVVDAMRGGPPQGPLLRGAGTE